MRAEPVDPVFIFLPLSDGESSHDDDVVDPVCGRALSRRGAMGRLRHRRNDHYFCSLNCAERFAATPHEFT